MKYLHTGLLPLALAPALPVEARPYGFSNKCAALATTLADHLPQNTTITGTDFVVAGTIFNETLHPTCSHLAEPTAIDVCRVRMTSHTGPQSRVVIEGWLPTNWNGRFLEVGNGGLGGCVDYSAIHYGAKKEFAAFGTDNGHSGNTGEYFTIPGVLEDYSHRALRVGATLGKKTAELFYGKPHDKAYWLGCSTGGRQGFVAAQYFPDDFDGIVAGAPAFNQRNLQLWAGSFLTYTGTPGSPTWLSEELWQVVLKDILEQCDRFDGQADGIFENPSVCDYKPENLICSNFGNQTSKADCLTGVQADTVRKVFSPLYDNEGQKLFSALTYGADSTTYYWNGQLAKYALDQMRYIVYKDPSWNGTIGMKEIIDTKNSEVPFTLDAYNPDLSEAQNAGTKILHYHGLQDPAIPSTNSDMYYNMVSRKMSLPPRSLDEFYRYFRISGLAHCRGGTGALNIGTAATLSPGGKDAGDGLLDAMVEWVEGGKAPEYVLGSAFKDDEYTDIAFQRRHCKYPASNVYSGSGDPDSADSWGCVS